MPSRRTRSGGSGGPHRARLGAVNRIRLPRRADGALTALDAALALDPSHATAHQRRGKALHALGRMPEAEAAGRNALALDPLSAVINNALAYVYLGRPDNDEAIRFWRRAVAMEPDA